MKEMERFPLDTVDLDTRLFIAERRDRIRSRLNRAAEDIVAIGADLRAIRERLEPGQFLGWIAAEFEMSERSAYNFMSVAEQFATVASLEGISAKALYMLAAPSTPENARAEAIAAASDGERIGPHQAEEIIERHQPPIEQPESEEQEPDRPYDPATATGAGDQAYRILPLQATEEDNQAEAPEPLSYSAATEVVERLEWSIANLVDNNDPADVFTITYTDLVKRTDAAGDRLQAWVRMVGSILEKRRTL